MLKWTGERYIPEMEPGIIHYEHLHRYKFAAEFVKDKIVLDLACGEGYGSFLMADTAKKVVGVDIDKETIEHALLKYRKDNLEFVAGSMTDIPLPGEKLFDVIICFEAIEHIKEQEQLIEEVKRLLRDDGIFIISTPNACIYSQKPGYNISQNPFHLKEMSYEEFGEILKTNFKEVFIYGQKIYPVSNIFPIFNSNNLAEITEYCIGKEFSFVDSIKKEAVYFIALASNSLIPMAKSGSYLTDISEFVFKKKDFDIEFLKNSLEEKNNNIAILQNNLKDKDEYINNLQNNLKDKDDYIQHVQETYVWRVYAKFWNFINKVLPVDTRRRAVAKYVFTMHKILKQKLTEFFLPEKVQNTDAEEKNKITDIELLERLNKEEFELFLSNPKNIFEFSASLQPEASIIIVVLNNPWLTFRCLKSIKERTNPPYEIIIVDNNSEGKTKLLLSRVKGAKIITNSENYGFTKACNQAGKIAASRHIVLLNNDTEVLENWLSELILAAEKNEKCGAVGGKLLLYNGKLQEAGSIIWNDGSTSGYGRNDNPSKPEYSYLREVDYCSGACLLIKSDLFRNFGGFDERFSPAYYEEADFCFRLRKKGYKIIYQPAAKVMHRESSSSLPPQVLEWSVKNRAKFIEKWPEELKNHYSPCAENILFARDRKQGLKVLFIDDRIPVPFLGSGYPRTFSLLEILSKTEHKVTFFPLQEPKWAEFYTPRLQEMGIEVLYNNGGVKLDIEDFLKKRQNYYDVIWISRPHNIKETLAKIKTVCPNAKIIYDAESLFSEREILKLSAGGINLSEEEKEEMINKEIFLFKSAAEVVTVSELDKEKITKRGIKNSTVIGYPLILKPTNKYFSERQDILFAGSLSDPESPNRDAIIYFANEIFPKIQKKLKMRLIIAGTNTDRFKEIRDLSSSSIIIKGFVKNLEELYKNCRVFIVPTRYSAGISLKLLEAMSYGIPSVVFFLSAKQLGLVHGREALIARTSDEFAENVISLYSDELLWNQVWEGSLSYIRDNCSPAKLKKELIGILSIKRQ